MSDNDYEKLYEVISVYFSNIYFCKLYERARDLYIDVRFKTIEQAYRNAVESFNNAFKQKREIHGRENEYYPQIVGDIARQYNMFNNVKYSYNTFIDLICKSLVPADTYVDMYQDHITKNNIVRTILVKTVNNFTVYILVNQFERSLDIELRNSKDPEKLRSVNHEWKEKFKEMLLQERSEYYSLIVAKRHGVNINNQTEIDMVPVGIVKKLEGKMRELIDEKNKIIQDRNKIADFARLLRERVEELELIIVEMSQKLQQPVQQQFIQQMPPTPKQQTPKPQIDLPVPIQKHEVIDDPPIESIPEVEKMLNTKYEAFDMKPIIKPAVISSELEEIEPSNFTEPDTEHETDSDVELNDDPDLEDDQ